MQSDLSLSTPQEPDSTPAGQPQPAPVKGNGGRSVLPVVSLVLSAIAAVLAATALMIVTGVIHAGIDSDFDRQARAFILGNPEVIFQSVQAADAQSRASEENELTALLVQKHDEIFNDPAAPVGVNANGDVTLVEFFDYNCPYCRKAAPMLDALEQADKGVRLVYKEFPILGPGSTFAAKAALASRKQGKYLAFHNAMMAYAGSITESSALEVAVTVGLDVEQLKKDMADPAIEAALAQNFSLAEALRITGTPGFVAGKDIVRGLAGPDEMKQLIDRARKG